VGFKTLQVRTGAKRKRTGEKRCEGLGICAGKIIGGTYGNVSNWTSGGGETGNRFRQVNERARGGKPQRKKNNESWDFREK